MTTHYQLNSGETVRVMEIQNCLPGLLTKKYLMPEGAQIYHTTKRLEDLPLAHVEAVFIPLAIYTLQILNGRNRGSEIRLTDREMVLNGAVMQLHEKKVGYALNQRVKLNASVKQTHPKEGVEGS